MQQPDGVAFPVGDAIAGGGPEEVYAKVGSYYHDPYLLGLARDLTPGDFGKLFDLLFRDYETKPRLIEDLPLTKYFPSPCGAMVARTGWDIGPDSRDAAVFMHIGEAFFGNHQHYDFGTFQIAYRGHLAIASGYYDDFGGQHNRKCNKWTPAIWWVPWFTIGSPCSAAMPSRFPSLTSNYGRPNRRRVASGSVSWSATCSQGCTKSSAMEKQRLKG